MLFSIHSAAPTSVGARFKISATPNAVFSSEVNNKVRSGARTSNRTMENNASAGPMTNDDSNAETKPRPRRLTVPMIPPRRALNATAAADPEPAATKATAVAEIPAVVTARTRKRWATIPIGTAATRLRALAMGMTVAMTDNATVNPAMTAPVANSSGRRLPVSRTCGRLLTTSSVPVVT